MGMALKSDVSHACQMNGTGKPVDLVHLSSLTMGDKHLEIEILEMFSAQIPQYLEMANASKDQREIRRAAHTIKGAARGVGAFRLAELAAETEESGAFDLKEMTNEMKRIQDYISLISSEN